MSALTAVLNKMEYNMVSYFTEPQSQVMPDNIRRVVRELEEKTGDVIKLPTNLDLDALFAKVKAARSNSTVALTVLEKNSLPFIIYHREATIEDSRFILDNMRSSKKKMLMRELYVYFMNYSSSSRDEMVRQDIIAKIPHVTHASKRFICWTQSDCLLEKNAENLIVDYLENMDFQVFMKKIMFDSLMFTSGLLKVAITKFFSKPGVEVITKLKKFYEMNEYGVLDAVFAQVANNLIPAVDANNIFKDDKIKLRDIFYGKYGDPRLPENSLAWGVVNPEVKRIFLKWISQFDVELFLKIIEKVSETQWNAANMWYDRQKFWLKHLSKVTSAWVFLGREAVSYANKIDGDKLTDYGEFEGDGKKSAILFTIGNHTFIERSYNGACVIWNKEECLIHVGDSTIKENDIVHGDYIKARVNHIGRWQGKIENYIY